MRPQDSGLHLRCEKGICWCQQHNHSNKTPNELHDDDSQVTPTTGQYLLHPLEAKVKVKLEATDSSRELAEEGAWLQLLLLFDRLDVHVYSAAISTGVYVTIDRSPYAVCTGFSRRSGRCEKTMIRFQLQPVVVRAHMPT